jgi:uncharacterized protein with NRDE domain
MIDSRFRAGHSAGMCLIAFAWQTHPDLLLALAANRDEFHDRAAAPADWWTGRPEIFGGRDLTQGGGWLALSRKGRLAAVTNVRRMIPPSPDALSRGRLVADFVDGKLGAVAFAEQLGAAASDYSGFNLLLFDGQALIYCTNQADFRIEAVGPGVHVLSNASLGTPWPKSQRLRLAMQAFVNQRVATRNLLFSALADNQPAPDEQLPDTGVGLEVERMLSPPFIRGERYGTRACTVVTLSNTGHAEFIERRFGKNGAFGGETRQAIEINLGSLH